MATNSLGNCAKTNILIAEQLGTLSENVSSIYETGNIYLKDSVSYIDTNTGNKRINIDADGTIKETGKTKYFSGGNIDTGTELFFTGLNTNLDYVVHTNATNNDSITVNHTTGVVTIFPTPPSNPIQPLTLNTSGNITGATVVYDGSTIQTFSVGDNGTNLNTPNTLVQRDSAGNFSAGTITGSLAGNATTATSSTNILGGVIGNLPVQTAPNTTSFISNGTLGYVLTAQGAGNLPIYSATSTVNDGILSINNGTHITGNGTFTANQAGNTSITIGTDATDINTPSTIVSRDSAGNFSAGAISASLLGNATTSTTAVNIQGGSGGVVVYQSGASSTSFTAVGVAGQYLQSAGTSAPVWATVATPSDAIITLATTGHLSGGSSFTLNQSGNQTITLTSDATNNNTALTIVSRDSAGAFSSGVITTPSVISLTDLTLDAGTVNVIQILKQVNFNGNLITNLLSLAGVNNINLPISALGTGSISFLTNLIPRLTISSTGGSTFSGSLSLNSTLIDNASSSGASGSILSSTSTATSWITQASLVAGSATNLAGGTAYSFPYQTGANSTTFLTASTAGSVLTTQGVLPPTWTTQSSLVAGLANELVGGVAGAIVYQSGVNTTNFSSAGILGQVLTSGGAGTPTWTTTTAVNNGTLTISAGTHMSGSGTFTANQSGNTSFTISTDATSANTASTIVSRSATGNFTAGTITADLIGEASLVNVTNTATNANFPLAFVSGTGDNIAVRANASILVNPSVAYLQASAILATDYIYGTNVVYGGYFRALNTNWQGFNASGNVCFEVKAGGIYPQAISTRAVYVNSLNVLGTIASTRRVKEQITPYYFNEEAILSIKPYRFKYKQSVSDDKDWKYGFMAEDINNAGLPEMCGFDENGAPDYVAYERMCVAQQQIIKTMWDKIKILEEKIEKLK